MAQRGETESADFQAEQPIRLAHANVEVDTYSTLKLKEQSLRTDLGDKHPEVIRIRNQLDSLNSIMDSQKEVLKSGRSNFALNPKALFESYHQLLKNDIFAMDRREERLAALAKHSVQLASEMVTDEIQGESLYRDVQRRQALFDAAVDRLRDINLAKDYGVFINEVLSEPEPGLKVTPKLSMSMAIGLLLSVGMSVAGIGIAEYRDRRFRSTEDIQNSLQVQVLGKIPLVTASMGKISSVFKKTSKQEVPRTPQLLASDSQGADAFRKLRTSLIFGEGAERCHVLCITSPNPADGKSTTTGNLAISIGQLGRRVLIIDCDLRRPSQHSLFSLPTDSGLTTIIKNNLDPADLIRPTAHRNVYLLPRGESVDNPAEFLATGEFATLLESLRDKYDQILIDCPPILPVVDALTTAALADGVLMVIRVETTTQLQAQTACSSLRQAGAELEGVVINGVINGSLDDDSYGYGYGYGYDDQYSRYSEYKTMSAEDTTGSRNGVAVSRVSGLAQRNGSSNGMHH